MKFATGLVLAAIAVTAANAGNPAYLRSTVSDDASGSDDFDFSDSLDASGSDDLLDDEDLTIDLTDLFGSDSDSEDGSHLKINIMSLIGSGSDQVDIQDIIDAFEEAEGSDASGSDDLSWLLDSDSGSDDDDEILLKGGKGKTLVDDSGSDDLSWLQEDDDSESGIEDPVLVKGATKGKAPVVDDDSGSDDDLSSIGTLYDDGSEGTIGDTEEDPILVKGATKGKTPLYEDDSDSESASDEEDHLQTEQSDSAATKTATKSSKTLW
ncbi:hypothetical protein AM587_10007999 [Phytophthora nicotianae]|uniref:Uncharacterized protein n=1 Tax=Phytophthora nicotianae TaxID=4792 RepID=A0A0W8CPE2_PHYNI|nr:hypothetical protein AM587_10007999 [Phytophthora nicotianae]